MRFRSLHEKNLKLKDEKSNALKKIGDLELLLKQSTKRLDEISGLIKENDREEKSLQSNLEYIKRKDNDNRNEIYRLQAANEGLQMLLNKYRNDMSEHRKFAEEMSNKRTKLQEQKDRLSRETLAKKLEAQTAKEELKKLKGSHGRLMEDHANTAQELEALKDHTLLLESQNWTVFVFLIVVK